MRQPVKLTKNKLRFRFIGLTRAYRLDTKAYPNLKKSIKKLHLMKLKHHGLNNMMLVLTRAHMLFGEEIVGILM